VLAALALLGPAPAAADNFLANNAGDQPDAVCRPEAGVCNLRTGILRARETPGPDTIFLGGGTYKNLGDDFVIAPGEAITIQGAGRFRNQVREVSGGDGHVFVVEAGARLTLDGLDVTGARAGAIVVRGDGAELHAARVGFSDDHGGDGGALAVLGGARADVTASLFESDSAAGRGGGVFVDGPNASVRLADSTLTGDGAATGTAVHVEHGTLELAGSTVMGTGGMALAPALFVGPLGAARAERSVLEDCAGARPVSAGHNLQGPAATCGLTGATDRTGDPLLRPLGWFGGPTQSREPRRGSPVLDAGGGPPGCPRRSPDQRRIPRPQGRACDIGAFEVEHPTISRLRVVPSRFRRTALVRFRLDVPARVRFDMIRLVPGRRPEVHLAAWTRTYRFGEPVSEAFPRRIGGRALAPGAYRLRLRPDSRGWPGPPVSTNLVVSP
jgi:hypothetical protein